MKRGEVVEVDWPFSDLTGSKKRPAGVVQADFLNGLIDDTILVKITSRILKPLLTDRVPDDSSDFLGSHTGYPGSPEAQVFLASRTRIQVVVSMEVPPVEPTGGEPVPWSLQGVRDEHRTVLP
jgi:hypothetical protein